MQPLYPLENSKSIRIKIISVVVSLCINAIWYTVIQTREYNDENDNG